jgi:hypothetical protein
MVKPLVARVGSNTCESILHQPFARLLTAAAMVWFLQRTRMKKKLCVG